MAIVIRTARHGDISLAEPGEPAPAGLSRYSRAELLWLCAHTGDLDTAAAIKQVFGGTICAAQDTVEIASPADRRPLCGPRGLLIERLLARKA